MTPTLNELLLIIRQHPAYHELLNAPEKPRIRPFRTTQSEQVEKARAQWIYDSGLLAGHKRWMQVLTGEVQEENND